MPACLILLPGTLGRPELLPLLQEAHSRRCGRVYISIQGAQAVQVDQQLLQWLAELYAAVGPLDPRWDVVPCLECAGWTSELLQTLQDVQLLLTPAALQGMAEDLRQKLADSRHGEAAAAVQVHTLPEPQQPSQQPPAQQQQEQQEEGQGADRQQQQQLLLHSNVAVGGTFDRLHAGHRLLLAATALVATDNVYVGITADNLLAKKSNKHLLQGYNQRQAAAVGFMSLVRPSLSVAAGALTDPQEPTQAELDPGMQALVVSAETVAGGEAINAGRRARGFKPVHLVVVGLVGGDDASSKLSSTALRQADAGSTDASALGAAQ